MNKWKTGETKMKFKKEGIHTQKALLQTQLSVKLV